MRQTIEREVLKGHFVPTTGGAARAPERERGEPEIGIRAPMRTARPTRPGVETRTATDRPFGRMLRRAVSTVFWALAGEKTYARAVSQESVPAALLNGSLAAGAAYLQERAAQPQPSAFLYGVSKRSLISFYAVMGLGLGLGAVLMNRRRGE